MPTIAIIAGVRVIIYPKDHLPPHLHAKFAEFEVMISILTGDVLAASSKAARGAGLARRKPRARFLCLAGGARTSLQRREDRSMNYRIADVSVVRHPILKVTFDDGLSGEYDLSKMIADGPIFKPLRDPDYFAKVAVAEYGHSFGWNLDDLGNEIDFCPDATRIKIKELKVAELAEHYRTSRTAAE